MVLSVCTRAGLRSEGAHIFLLATANRPCVGVQQSASLESLLHLHHGRHWPHMLFVSHLCTALPSLSPPPSPQIRVVLGSRWLPSQARARVLLHRWGSLAVSRVCSPCLPSRP